MTKNKQPAFPSNPSMDEYGMTMRDYFAAKAMQGLMPEYSVEGWEKIVARKAYEVADEMMEARK
jgi:hypothetical protein